MPSPGTSSSHARWPGCVECRTEGFMRHLLLIISVLGAVACSRAGTTDAPPTLSTPHALKTLTIGFSTPIKVLGYAGPSFGASVQVIELYANGLITSEPQSQRPVARLAASVPSLDDGSVQIL